MVGVKVLIKLDGSIFFLSFIYTAFTTLIKGRKKMLTGKICGMAHTTELGSKLSEAVRKNTNTKLIYLIF